MDAAGPAAETRCRRAGAPAGDGWDRLSRWPGQAHQSWRYAREDRKGLVPAGIDAFEAFEGVPLVTVWDNPKTVVLSRKGDLIVWNPVFGQVALDYRFAPELCWPRAANQKGALENLVGWVKGSFFKCRRFHDRADLEQQLVEWLTAVNTQRPNRATGVIPALRLAQERARLRPLPIPPPAYALKIPVVVRARARVGYAGGEYSMPPATLGQPATLHLYRDRVEIVTKAGEPVCHPRLPASGGLSVLPEHRAAILARVPGLRGRLYFQRQSLCELGPAAEAWLTELVHRRPARWRDDVESCFALLQEHGPGRLLAAFAAGVRQHTIGAEYVTAALRSDLGALRLFSASDQHPSASQSDSEPAANTWYPPGEEVSHRAQTRIQRCVRRARFPFLKTIDEYDFTFQAAVRLSLLGSFLGPELVTQGQCLVLSGAPGTGKTHLAVAIAYRAIQNGFEALFTTATALIDELSTATRKGKLRQVLPL